MRSRLRGRITKMEPTEMALEIADDIRLLQSQLDAAKDWILDQPGAPTREKLDSQLFQRDSNLRNDQKFRDKSDELRNAIRGQDDAQDILRSLHSFLKAGKMTV
jgi:hypothetical protein